MIRTYCDRCSEELASKDHGRVKIHDGLLMIEIMTGWDGTMNAGHVCHSCIRKAVIACTVAVAVPSDQRGVE